eukprot:2594766-Pyramimonas_sp.AAC.1
MGDDRADAVHELMTYWRAFNARWLDWAALANWNMEIDELQGPWLEAAQGVPIVLRGLTCWQRSEGS